MENVKIVTINDKKIKLVRPTLGIASEGDLEYSKAYTKALQNGLIPKVVMDKLCIETGAWTAKDDEEVATVSKRLHEIMEIFATSGDNKDSAKLEFYELRNRLTIITAKRQSSFTHTAESKGEEAKISSLACKCILNEDGSKIWKNLEEFYNETNLQFVSQAVQEFVAFTSGLGEQIDELEKIFDGPSEETPKETIEKIEEIKKTEEEIK